ncbi:MAG: hypothetical protein RLZZ230_611 [Candidatus Parcubacteria bacterium]
MKNRHILSMLSGGIEDSKKEIKEKLKLVKQEIDEVKAQDASDPEIYTLSETRLGYVIELLRLRQVTPERVGYEVKNIKSQCRAAEYKFSDFDADEQHQAEKISLLINWGKLIVTARTCGIEREGEIVRFRKEASQIFKQSVLKKCDAEKSVSIETWLSAMSDTLKIFSKLKVNEQDIALFFKYSLSTSI